jgi:hypothetical protein
MDPLEQGGATTVVVGYVPTYDVDGGEQIVPR